MKWLILIILIIVAVYSAIKVVKLTIEIFFDEYRSIK